MKSIVIYTDGTLGDHLPSIALAQALVARGYRVRMAINQAMHEYAQRAGLEAIALTDVERGPEQARKNAWAWNHWRDPASPMPPDFKPLGPDHMATQAQDLIEICRGADLLLATSIRILGYIVHQALNIPWITLALNPSMFWRPDSAEEEATFQQSRLQEFDQLRELLGYIFPKLGIDKPLPDWRHGVLFAKHILLASSPHFSQPNVEQFQPHNSLDLTGFWFYQDSAWQDWQPDATLSRFCERHPLVLSFSSQPLEERRQTLSKHVQAAARLGRPLLIQRGWADFSEDDVPHGANPQDILFADFIPHDWLFAHAACAIQHGGIGSIARALRQGCPLLIEPYGNDQFFNAERVTDLGVGTNLSPFHSTVNDLCQALNDIVLTPKCRERAQAAGTQLRGEDGVTTACDMIERYLNRFDAQGRLPSVYEVFTPSLSPRKRAAPVDTRGGDPETPTNHSLPHSPVAGTKTAKSTLILFYNSLWGQPLDLQRVILPEDCRWTTDLQYLPTADAVVFHIPDLGNISGLVKPPGQIWIAWSMESKLNYPLLQDPAFMQRFDLTMTYERHSDIPVPYYSLEMMQALQSPPHPKSRGQLAVLFVSGRVDHSGRLAFLSDLMRHLNIDSYGRKLNNRSLVEDQGRPDKLAVIAKYKFTLAFENAISPDYVTEKFFDPLQVGSVPVYLGAPNIDEFAPGEHCFINVNDFSSPEELAKYLQALDTDDTAYAAYLAWRRKPLRSKFLRLLETQREHFLVRLYQKVQRIKNSRADRELASHAAVEPIPTTSTDRNAPDGAPTGQPVIPHILHQTWKDENLPEEWVAYRQTWLTHHPAWEFHLWTDAENREFIRQNYAWFLPIYDSYPENIMRADAIRYFILYHYGGVYADLDVECLRPIDPLLKDRQLLFGLEHPSHARGPLAHNRGLQDIVGNAVMASTPQHPFWDHVFRQLIAFHRAPSPLDATGPFLLTRAYGSYAHPEQIHVASHHWFYPISNDKPWSAIATQVQAQIIQDAYTIHHWQGNWWREAVAQQAQQAKLTLMVRGEIINLMVMFVDRYRAVLSAQADLPKISCLMVTKNRVAWAKRSIQCFRQQTYANRELVIVDDSADDALEQSLQELADPLIIYVRVPDEGRSLGELRNRAIAESTGAYVAQWDDDDLSDPMRLELQMAVISGLQADACFLERHQLLWLTQRRLAMSTHRVWESSFLCAKSKLPAYPALRRGEDTPVIQQIVDRERVALLDLPQLYTYVFHGANTFPADHWENHWLMATESFEGPLFDGVLRGLEERLNMTLPIESTTS